jgi:hypothetical protein
MSGFNPALGPNRNRNRSRSHSHGSHSRLPVASQPLHPSQRLLLCFAPSASSQPMHHRIPSSLRVPAPPQVLVGLVVVVEVVVIVVTAVASPNVPNCRAHRAPALHQPRLPQRNALCVVALRHGAISS